MEGDELLERERALATPEHLEKKLRVIDDAVESVILWKRRSYAGVAV